MFCDEKHNIVISLVCKLISGKLTWKFYFAWVVIIKQLWINNSHHSCNRHIVLFIVQGLISLLFVLIFQFEISSIFKKKLHQQFFFFIFSLSSLNRYSKREEAQEAIASLNNVIPQGGNQPLIVRVAEEHGRAKAALFLPQYNQFVQNRGRMRVRNQPY